VTFTRQTGFRYGVDVSRESGPPARLRVVKLDAEWLPREIAHFLVEREFGLKLGIFGQLAAGGDAGRFWAAPADRDSRLAHLSHRLQVTGRGDLGRSVALVAWCTAAWEVETGRRSAGPRDAGWAVDPARRGGHTSRTGCWRRPLPHLGRRRLERAGPRAAGVLRLAASTNPRRTTVGLSPVHRPSA
jgi:hypothetical protein